MFISAIDEALVDVRELHGNLVLLLVAQCIVIYDLLVKLVLMISKDSTEKNEESILYLRDHLRSTPPVGHQVHHLLGYSFIYGSL